MHSYMHPYKYTHHENGTAYAVSIREFCDHGLPRPDLAWGRGEHGVMEIYEGPEVCIECMAYRLHRVYCRHMRRWWDPGGITAWAMEHGYMTW